MRHDRVYRLKREFPDLGIVLNGGISGVEDALRHLQALDGVMLGRAAYHDPWLLADLQLRLFGTAGVESRQQAVHRLSEYIARQTEADVPVKHISRHVLGLFQGLPGARRWRRHISQHAHLEPDNDRLLLQALAAMELDRPAAPGAGRCPPLAACRQ